MRGVHPGYALPDSQSAAFRCFLALYFVCGPVNHRQMAGQGEERGTIVVHATIGSMGSSRAGRGMHGSQSEPEPRLPLSPAGDTSATQQTASGSGSDLGRQYGPLQLCLLQEVPWWLHLWLHTLQLSYDTKVRKAESPTRTSQYRCNSFHTTRMSMGTRCSIPPNKT